MRRPELTEVMGSWGSTRNYHTARFQVFEALGLATPENVPHAALVQRSTELILFLPPRPL